MRHSVLGIAAVMLMGVGGPTLFGQSERGPYARIALLRPHDGATVDFESGYIRHLDWHRQAKDPFVCTAGRSGPVHASDGLSTPRLATRPPV